MDPQAAAALLTLIAELRIRIEGLQQENAQLRAGREEAK